MRARIGVGTYVTPIADRSTHAVAVIDYAHHEIHSGSHYKAGYQDSTMDTNETIMLLFVTPDSDKESHWALTVQTAGGGATIRVYEGTVTSNDGTPVTRFNRNSDNVSTTLVYHTPTVVSDGTQFVEKWVGDTDKQGDTGGEARGNSEFILKRNTKYLVRLTANGNGMKGAIGGDWYEHTERS